MRLGEPIRGFSRQVDAVAVGCVDGKEFVVTGGEDGTVLWFDADPWRERGALRDGYKKPSCGVISVLFVAWDRIYCRSHAVECWDARSGAVVFERRWEHEGGGLAAGRWQDAPALFAGGRQGSVAVLDPRTGGELARLHPEGLTGRVQTVVVGSAGYRDALVMIADDAVGVWALDEDPVLWCRPAGKVWAVTVGTFGARSVVVCGHADGMVTMHDPRTGDLVRDPLVGHSRGVVDLVLTDDALLSCGEDFTVRRWTTWGEPEVVRLPSDPSQIAWSPRTGRIWATGYDEVYPIDL